MPELLQRATGMKVIQVKDRTLVQPDRVYVIPPNKDMSILHGVLHLLDPASPRGLRLPIDFFLRSLAQDRQERGIGVILSGMGSDGTLGLRAIKEKAGLVLVQDPATAKFDGMPRSAIDAGLADIVAPVDELPGRILAYLRRAPLVTRPETRAGEQGAERPGEGRSSCCARHTGHDFSLYKTNTFYRRIERRMGIHQIDKIADYVRYLQENSQELDLLFKELLIGVTSFFRDPAAWEELREQAIPALLAGRPPGQALRAWVPGCSTGEEAYSLAMVFREALEQAQAAEASFTLQVFATDLDQDAIDKARLGVYPANIAADVSPERLSRFFVKEKRGYRVGKEIREMVVFAPHNLVMDPPFTKLDILSCRNLLIYLAPETAEEAHSALSLQPESRRHPVSRQRRNRRRLHRPVFLARRQSAALPAGRVRHAGRAGRVPVVLRPAAARRRQPRRRRRSAGQPPVARRSIAPWSATPRRPCSSTTTATSCTSVAGRESTWNLPRARPTGMSWPWPARACATSSPAPSRKRSDETAAVALEGLRVGTNGGISAWTSPCSASKSRSRCAGC